MQTHYFELRAVPQIEITEVDVINQMMQSLHQIFVKHKSNIGISFPNYRTNQQISLGGIIRLFGSEQDLHLVKQAIMQQSTISSYAIVNDILNVPQNLKGHLRLKRFRTKGQSALKRAEKRLKMQGKWSEQIKNNIIEKWGSMTLHYPHIQLSSQSTGQKFILWIEQQKKSEQVEGEFNYYGLSKTATVPDF